jgi:hypothetical protein
MDVPCQALPWQAYGQELLYCWKQKKGRVSSPANKLHVQFLYIVQCTMYTHYKQLVTLFEFFFYRICDLNECTAIWMNVNCYGGH